MRRCPCSTIIQSPSPSASTAAGLGLGLALPPCLALPCLAPLAGFALAAFFFALPGISMRFGPRPSSSSSSLLLSPSSSSSSESSSSEPLSPRLGLLSLLRFDLGFFDALTTSLYSA